MDPYPVDYTEHNAPLVLLSGLGERHDNATYGAVYGKQEGGARVSASSPECNGERADQLLNQFLQLDGGSQPWIASALPGHPGSPNYKIKTIGRTYTFPPRKAAPLPQPTSPDGFQNGLGSPTRTELHSPLSPLSPGSPIFPDGVFTPLWFAKHQHQVPAIFIAFFHISATGNTAQDEKLKADINAIRTALNRSGFKTKFATVLMSEQSTLNAPELEERLASIRRLTGLDPKTGLFFMPPISSQSEIAAFVHNVISALHPLCIEYYRDLTKHARRKKARGGSSATVSSTVGAGSQSLSTPGWNVRYEVKQGIFAEFRHEMDVAERHYSAAIDELFNSEGIFEATPSWSPRWDEARLLCDTLAIRVLRAQLSNAMTTGAVKSWVNYKFRMKDLLDRRGKGSQTYGWAAWEAKWAEIMAQLIQRADLPSLRPPTEPLEESTELSSRLAYVSPEKYITAERIPPFQYLHHSGYWLKLAARASRARRRRALAIPEEDRIPPGQSPASAVARRAGNYDYYLVPEPHEEYRSATDGAQSPLADIQRLTAQAIGDFEDRNQRRMAESTKLELAQDFMEAERYGEAMSLLLPLWQESTWRSNDWPDLFADLSLSIRRCAEQEKNQEVLVASTYELLSVRSSQTANACFNLAHCLDDMEALSDGRMMFSYQDSERRCPVAISFAFDNKNTHVGEALGCQFGLTSCANDKSAPLTLSSVKLSFGGLRSVKVNHDLSAQSDSDELIDLSLTTESNDGFFEAKANLELKPGQKRLFNFDLIFREPEEIRLTQASLSISTDRFEIMHTFNGETILCADSMFIQTSEGLERKFLRHTETDSAIVLPKPPKVKMLVHGLRKQYYTDELVHLTVEVINEEGETVDGTVSAQIGDDSSHDMSLRWTESDTQLKVASESHQAVAVPVETAISKLEPAASCKMALFVKAPTDAFRTTLVLTAKYNLSTDNTSPLEKILSTDLSFVIPFEAKFNFGPMLHRVPWPSYFDPQKGTTRDSPGGITQLWILGGLLRSLATEKVVLHKLEATVDNIIGDSQAKFHAVDAVEKHPFAPSQVSRYTFEILTQKHSLDDRRQTTLESTLAVTWSHGEDSELVTTHLPVPRLSLPVSEPRVLCTLAETPPAECDAVLQYHIENPSTHFLTFALTMEASEDFAFSGPKYRALSLAPLSRHSVEYRIALHGEDDTSQDDGFWIWPALQVIDSYYQKTLKVHPGGPGVKLDDKQNIGVWIEKAQVGP